MYNNSNKAQRAELKRQKRQTEKDKAIYLYSHDTAKAAVDEQVHANLAKIQKQCLTSLFVIASLALHDEFGFGHQRISKFLSKCQIQYECLNAGYINIDDLIHECEKFGIIIKK